jgi:hypothetical protein
MIHMTKIWMLSFPFSLFPPTSSPVTHYDISKDWYPRPLRLWHDVLVTPYDSSCLYLYTQGYSPLCINTYQYSQ